MKSFVFSLLMLLFASSSASAVPLVFDFESGTAQITVSRSGDGSLVAGISVPLDGAYMMFETTTGELLDFATRIAENVDIPVLGDADNGGGNPLTVYRTTQAFERAGLGGVMFEDRIRIDSRSIMSS